MHRYTKRDVLTVFAQAVAAGLFSPAATLDIRDIRYNTEYAINGAPSTLQPFCLWFGAASAWEAISGLIAAFELGVTEGRCVECIPPEVMR